MIAEIRGTQLMIKIGDAASPEVFSHPCLINTKRGIQFQSSANKVIIPDCDNPDDPAWVQVIKDQLSASISGAGVLDTADVADYDAWFNSDDAKNVEIWLGAIGKWTGSFKLTSWEVNGDRNQNAEVTLTLESHGALAAYAAA